MTYSANEQDMLNVLEKHIAAEMQGDMWPPRWQP
jgi:hypothetical protein